MSPTNAYPVRFAIGGSLISGETEATTEGMASKEPRYDKNRYANGPEYAEQRKAARRERYANDPKYRAREKQRRREFAENNPDYKRKRRDYMREYRKHKKAQAESLCS